MLVTAFSSVSYVLPCFFLFSCDITLALRCSVYVIVIFLKQSLTEKRRKKVSTGV